MFRKPVIAFALLCALAAVVVLYFGSPFARSQTQYSHQFSADRNHFAFSHATSPTDHVLVLFNPQTSQHTIVKSKSGVPGVPTFDGDGSLLVGILPRINPPSSPEGLRSHLYRCDLDSRGCTELFSADGAISNAISIGGEDILFVGAELAPRADPFAPSSKFLGYRGFDFFLKERSGAIRRLTELRAYTLTSVSHSEAIGTIAFEMSLPKVTGSNDVYCGVLERDSAGGIDLTVDSSAPCVVVGKNIDARPSLSGDGRHLALKSSARSGKGGWIYEVVVVTFPDGEHVTTIAPKAGNNTLSSPVFVDDETIRFMEFQDGRYNFYEYAIPTDSVKQIGSLVARDLVSRAERTIDLR